MTLENKLEHLEETFAEIKNIDPATGRNKMTNYDNFIEGFQRAINIISVRVCLEKAENFYADKKEINEKEWLFNAFSTIKENNISNEDLRTVPVVDYTTGNILTLSDIEQRLEDLGWKG